MNRKRGLILNFKGCDLFVILTEQLTILFFNRRFLNFYFIYISFHRLVFVSILQIKKKNNNKTKRDSSLCKFI